MKRVVVAVVSGLAITFAGAGVARSAIDVADFQAALSALSAVDPALAVEAQANSSSERDFAVGGGQSSVGSNFGLSSHSGPSGEDAFGHVSETFPDDGKYRARVVCLQVVTDITGVKRAGIIGQITESSSNSAPAGSFVRWSVTDTGLSGGNGDGFQQVLTSRPPNPMVCPPRPIVPELQHGNINIHDAQP
jgi:hypothetical protein